MLDYKSIIIKRYALGLSYKELAEEFSASKSGINDFIRAFEKAGIPLLENRSLELEFRGGRFLLAGVVDGWTQEKPDWDVLLPTDRLPRIVLTHAPDIFDDMPEPTALAVAGHTHGGQIAIPFYGPPMLPSRYHRRYASGLVREGRNTIFVTVGTGTSILPLRFLCPPESSPTG